MRPDHCPTFFGSDIPIALNNGRKKSFWSGVLERRSSEPGPNNWADGPGLSYTPYARPREMTCQLDSVPGYSADADKAATNMG
jgi:hypothetical protein